MFMVIAVSLIQLRANLIQFRGNKRQAGLLLSKVRLSIWIEVIARNIGLCAQKTTATAQNVNLSAQNSVLSAQKNPPTAQNNLKTEY